MLVCHQAVFGEYRWQTYAEVSEGVQSLGSGLLSLDAHQRANICIFAETRAEWIVAVFACFKANLPGRMTIDDLSCKVNALAL